MSDIPSQDSTGVREMEVDESDLTVHISVHVHG